MKYYSGIGSRQTPQNILVLMKSIALKLYEEDYVLNSGGAQGADKAFQSGAEDCVIYLKGSATPEAIKVAMDHHPAPQNCNDYVRKLHGRNAMIVLGSDLKTPVDFVICWTYKGNFQGGTALGMRIAEAYSIPVFNLAFDDVSEQWHKYIDDEITIGSILI